MAITSLDPNPEPWRDLVVELYQAATGEPADAVPAGAPELSPAHLALAALRRGYHVRLLRDPPLPGGDEEATAALRAAQAAGLVTAGGAPDEARVRQGLEAGHPLLLLTDAAERDDGAEPGARWLTLVGIRGDTLLLHDPGAEGGPEEELLSRLPALSGFQGRQALIEIAPGNHLRR